MKSSGWWWTCSGPSGRTDRPKSRAARSGRRVVLIAAIVQAAVQNRDQGEGESPRAHRVETHRQRGARSRVRRALGAGGVGLACLAASILGAAPAKADPASWLFLGGGDGRLESSGQSVQRGIFQFEAGLGSPADGAVVAGGMFKTLTFFGRGTDLVLALRGATGG